MKVDHVFWDMDGTMVHSESIAMGVVADAIGGVVIAAGKPWDREKFLLDTTGLSLSLICQFVEKEYKVRVPADIVKNNPGETLKALSERVTATDNVKNALNWLKAKKVGFSLVTSSAFDRVDVCLGTTQLDEFFDYKSRFSGSSSLPQPKHKPDPAIYLHALDKMNVDPAQAIAVEDSPTGVRAAVAAGITPIGYVGADHLHPGNRAHVVRALTDAGAVMVIENFRDLPAAIGKLEAGERFHFFPKGNAEHAFARYQFTP